MNEYTLDATQAVAVGQLLSDRKGKTTRELLNALSYNPRRVIELRYGIRDGRQRSVEEVADVFARPINWVIEIESCALCELYLLLVSGGLA